MLGRLINKQFFFTFIYSLLSNKAPNKQIIRSLIPLTHLICLQCVLGTEASLN